MGGTQRWDIDDGTSSVVFVASSSVHDIRSSGSAAGWFEASIDEGEFSDRVPLRGHLIVPIAGLSSGNPLVDREMRRRVDTAKHPAIAADIETSELITGRTATLTGTVSFLGIDVAVEGTISIEPEWRLTGIGEFDVRWWNLEPPRVLMLRVDPIVTVEIDLVLVEPRSI